MVRKEASCIDYEHKKSTYAVSAFLRVSNGARTHDPQNHNLVL